MSSAEQITNELRQLIDFIDDAHQRLDDGEVMDLSDLDDEVARLCDETLALKPEEAAQVQNTMAEMITKLEKLGVALQEYQQNLKDKNGLD